MCLIPGVASAAFNLGWADEFLDGQVECYSPVGGSMNCQAIAEFNPARFVSGAAPPTWSYLGQQGANATGRANARAKVMFRFHGGNSSTGSWNITASINRFRTTSIPSQGSACSGGAFVGTASQTFDSSAAGPNGLTINNRLLPTFNFAAETAIGDVGYQDQIAIVTGSGSVNDPGCYKIKWF